MQIKERVKKMERRKFIQNTALATGGLMAASPKSWAVNKLFENDSFAISPDWNQATSPLKHTWRGLGNVDQMRWVLRGDMQEQLKMCRDEIGLKHVRAVGIFDDDLWVYDNDPKNFHNLHRKHESRANFRTPFYLFDTLVEMGLSPMITPSFIPSDLASGEFTVFDTKNNVTPPRNWKQWEVFFRDFVKEMVGRYGLEAMKGWYYEAWNEPNLEHFWMGRKSGYWELYKILFNTVKEISPDMKIGGPSTARGEWILDFLEFCDKENLSSDYIIGHCYNNDSANAPLSPFMGPQKDKESNSPNFTSGVVRGIRQILDDVNYKGEFHMNEWGMSWYPFRVERETPNEAAFVVKTMSEVSQDADYHAYWCLSDIYNQVGYGKEAFHGNYGMLSFDGLRKPAYLAHQLLSKLGEKQMPFTASDPNKMGAMVTKKKGSVQVIAYTFDIDYVKGDALSSTKIEVDLPKGVKPNSAKLIKIDGDENNVRAGWEAMGSTDYLKKEEVKKLDTANNLVTSAEKPSFKKTDNGYVASFSIKGPGIGFLEVDI